MSSPNPHPISATTRYCAVLGHPIKHSASPAMQNAGIASLGLDWRYLAFDVHPDQLGAAIEGARSMKFIGLNLTIPHKLLAMTLVNELDASAKEWGAVNTVRFEGRIQGGEWKPLAHFAADEVTEVRSRGFNTDAGAIIRSLREDLDIDVRKASVLLLGAGGAGRVAALRLAAEGVKQLHLFNRTMDKAEAVAKEIQDRFPGVPVSVGYPKEDIDLLLNATSLGLKPSDPLPLDEKAFPIKKARSVYDMIYRPAVTPLLQTATQAGCRTANGLGMLLYQGAEALEIWTGKAAPVLRMKEALIKNIYG